jgi:hypothetical protein
MPPTPPPDHLDIPRRVVLIDLDWQEADLVPELLRRAEFHVRLVAGDSEDNAGLRVAELCGLPRTVELADLTREIFDLALLGEKSSRKAQVERLMTALGTPVVAPHTLMNGTHANGHGNGNGNGHLAHGVEPGAARSSAPNIATIADLDLALARALPDLAPAPEAMPSSGSGVGADSLPGPDNREGLELALADWARQTGVTSAVLHAGVGSVVGPLSRVGEEDALLDALIHLSLALETPHVLSRVDGPDRGKAWGAWPFRTRGLRGVLAAARFDPVEGRAQWEEAVQSLRVAWERHEREPRRAEAPTPASRPSAWLDREGFAARLEAAVARNRDEGVSFAIYRMRFDEAREALDRFCEGVPQIMREQDPISRPHHRDVLFLHEGPGASFSHPRRRLVSLWEEAWQQTGRPGPAPPILEERIDLVGRDDAAHFLATSGRWLGTD